MEEAVAALRLLAGLLAPCVALLALLSGLLLLRRARPRAPPPPPPPPCASCRRRARPRPSPASLPAANSFSPAAPGARPPPPPPPNSPASAWASGGIPDCTSGRQHSSAQRKRPSGSPAFPPWLHPAPFDYSSSIRRGAHERTQLNSANFTGSLGPGLDADFGASAGVSLRILSSDSEESPTAPVLHPQQSGRFEWDYYDPSYKKSTPLQGHLPCICSKQYWL